MKDIIAIHNAPNGHWVGDGFPVRQMFSYSKDAEAFSPFLLLDYAGPAEFPPGSRRRGVGEHPHRGFETVTIVYHGEVEHRDSTGAGGTIGPGDVQWMTAAAGIMHEEFHSQAFTRTGGTLEMIQLWVNLPAARKMSEPGYQGLTAAEIPIITLPDQAGTLRIIAGNYLDQHGPARTHTPMNVWDINLKAGRTHALELNAGWTTLIIVLHGIVLINHREIAREAQMAHLSRNGTTVTLEANTDSSLLILNGQPIDEPVVGHGPFVMNTDAEIRQAINDLNTGGFRRLAT
ncbi:MAG: pirin family protein [Thiotrichales bacterium]